MKRDRLDGLQIVLLGGVLAFLMSAIIARVNPYGMSDFRQFYYVSRCLIQHHDPYQESQLWAVYTAQVKTVPSDPKVLKWLHEILLCPNMPTTLLLMAPLEMRTGRVGHAPTRPVTLDIIQPPIGTCGD
jgi:hypothetical protein